MAKIKSKGTLLKQTISMTLTTVAQVLSLDVADSETEMFDSTDLSTTVWRTMDPTGYSKAGDVSGELFYDPALAGHQAFTDLLAAPADTVFTVTYADGSSTVQTFTASGYKFGATVAMNDGLKGKFTLIVDGDPGWPT